MTLRELVEAQEAEERHHRAEITRVLVESWNAKTKALPDRLLPEAGR